MIVFIAGPITGPPVWWTTIRLTTDEPRLREAAFIQIGWRPTVSLPPARATSPSVLSACDTAVTAPLATVMPKVSDRYIRSGGLAPSASVESTGPVLVLSGATLIV